MTTVHITQPMLQYIIYSNTNRSLTYPRLYVNFTTLLPLHFSHECPQDFFQGWANS